MEIILSKSLTLTMSKSNRTANFYCHLRKHVCSNFPTNMSEFFWIPALNLGRERTSIQQYHLHCLEKKKEPLLQLSSVGIQIRFESLLNSDVLLPRALTSWGSGEPGCTQSQYLCRGSLRPAAVAWPCSALWALFTVAGTLWSLCLLTCNNWLNSGPWNRWFFFPHCLFCYASHSCGSGSRQRVKLAVFFLFFFCAQSVSEGGLINDHPLRRRLSYVSAQLFSSVLILLSSERCLKVKVFHVYSGI